MDSTTNPRLLHQRRHSMKNAEAIEISRRRFTIAGLSAGAAMLAPEALFGDGVEPSSGNPQSAGALASQPGKHTSFASMKQIDAGLLNVGYAEDGPVDGPAVI